MYKFLIVLIFATTFLFAQKGSQETLVFNLSTTDTAGQIRTSGDGDFYWKNEDFKGLVTFKLDIDSNGTSFSDDSTIFYIDRKVGNTWVPSDTITWYAPALDTLATIGKFVTAADKDRALVSWLNPKPSAGIPTSLSHIGNQTYRMRKKSINIGNTNIYLILQTN